MKRLLTLENLGILACLLVLGYIAGRPALLRAGVPGQWYS